ncbi:hypothetical protein [Saccharothrix sp.]|nr:hypothetical protein [Saccharothrix sp.]
MRARVAAQSPEDGVHAPVRIYVGVKAAYGLSVKASERAALERVPAGCP